MIEAVNLLITATVAVKKQLAESNKAQAKFGKLAERLERVRNLLPQNPTDIETLYNTNQSIPKAINHLSTIADACQKEIDAYLNTSKLSKFFGASKHKESSVDLDVELDKCLLELNTALTAYNTAKADQARQQQNAMAQQQAQMAALQEQQRTLLRKIQADSITTSYERETTFGHPHTDRVNSIAVICDNWIATGSSDTTVKIWNLSNDGEGFTLRGHKLPITSVVALPGNLIASASNDRTIKIWNNGLRKVKTFTGHTAPISALATWPNSSVLISGADDCTLKRWDLETGDVLQTISFDAAVTFMLPLNYPRVLTCSEDHFMRIVNIQTGAVEQQFGDGKFKLGKVTLLSNGNIAVNFPYKNFVQIWNPMNGSFVKTLETRTNVISVLGLSDSKLLIGRGKEDHQNLKHIEIIDTNTGRVIKQLSADELGNNKIALSAQGELIACNPKGEIKIWDLSTLTELQTLSRSTQPNGFRITPSLVTPAYAAATKPAQSDATVPPMLTRKSSLLDLLGLS